jgi:WD40 repeat protein
VTPLLFALLVQAKPAEPGHFLEDPRFPIVAWFGTPDDRREWAVRYDDATLVVLSGPGRDWFGVWDLKTGTFKQQARAPRITDTVVQREIGPTGRYLFFLPAEETGKDGRRVRAVRYYDTTTGAASKTASFSLESPPQVKVSGSTADEIELIARYGGGFHPKQVALRDFISKRTKNQGLAHRIRTRDLLYETGVDRDRKTFVVIDAESPRVVAELQLPAAEVRFASVGPGKDTIILSGDANELFVADAGQKKVVRTLEGHAQPPVTGYKLNADSSRLLSTSLDKTTRLWDVQKGLEIFRLNEMAGEVGFLTSGGKEGVVVNGQGVRLLDREGRTTVLTVTEFTFAALFSADGKSAMDPHPWPSDAARLVFWTLDPPRAVREIRIPERCHEYFLSADGRHGLAVSQKTCHLLDRERAEPVASFPRQDYRPAGLLPGGGAWLAVQGDTLLAADLPGGAKRWSVDFKFGVRTARMNATGSHVLVVTGDGTPRVVDVATGQATPGEFPKQNLKTYEEAQLSSDGKTLVGYADKTVRWWTSDGKELKSWPVSAPNVEEGARLSISPDGQRAFLFRANSVATVTLEKGYERTHVFNKRIAYSMEMRGETAVIHGHGASAILRYAASK